MDVDYEDFGAFGSGTAEAWLISLTNQLRANLPSPYILTLRPLLVNVVIGGLAQAVALIFFCSSVVHR